MGLLAIIKEATSIIEDILIPLAFALCLFYFFWGIAMYLRSAGNEKESAKGKGIILWGLVGMFVAASVWGIVKLIKEELEIPGVETIEYSNTRINY